MSYLRRIDVYLRGECKRSEIAGHISCCYLYDLLGKPYGSVCGTLIDCEECGIINKG